MKRKLYSLIMLAVIIATAFTSCKKTIPLGSDDISSVDSTSILPSSQDILSQADTSDVTSNEASSENKNGTSSKNSTSSVATSSSPAPIISTENSKFIGKWRGSFDMTSAFDEVFSDDADLASYFEFSNLSINTVWEFNADSTYEMFYSETSIESMLDKLESQLTEGIEAYAQSDNAPDEYKNSPENRAAFVKTFVDAFSDAIYSSPLEYEGTYNAENGKLYTVDSDGESSVGYKFNGDSEVKLTATDDESLFVTLTLNKV